MSEKILEDGKELRTKLNKHLDEIERSFTEQLLAAKTNHVQETEKFLTDLTKREHAIKELRPTIELIEQVPSDVLKFLGVRKLSEIITKEEQLVDALKKDHRLDKVELKAEFNSDIENVISLPKYAELSVQNKPTSVLFQWHRESFRMAQTLRRIHAVADDNDIKNMHIHLCKKISIPKGKHRTQVQGCSILPDGKFVICDTAYDFCRTYRLVIFNPDGSLSYYLSQGLYSVYDVVFIDENTVACTSGNHKNIINIVDIIERRVVKTLNTDAPCYGISHSDGTLIYALENKGLQSFTMATEKLSSFSVDTPNVYRIATSEKKLYYIKENNSSIHCCEMDGEEIWEFRNEKSLFKPVDLTMDSKGNVFVADEEKSNIIIISANGKHHTQLLSKTNGLDKPSAVHFDLQRNQQTNCFLI